MSVERQERTLLPHQKNKEHLLDLYRKMFLIRRFEEHAGQEYMRGKIAGFLHLAIGEEAANVGMMVPLRPDDDVISHYRSHGQALARGLEPGPVMAELFGRATGVSKGQGGSMHLASKGATSGAATPSWAGTFPSPWAWRWPTSTPAATGSSSAFSATAPSTPAPSTKP